MLKSMTAFARQEIETPAGTLTWEIRSVNHRYLEPHFRLPDTLREIEPALREELKKALARGKIDCNLKFQESKVGAQGLELNVEALRTLKGAHDKIQQELNNIAPLDLFKVLEHPGVLDNNTVDKQTINKAAVSAFSSALKALNETRLREGSQLKPLFEERLNAIDGIVTQVTELLPQILAKQAENIRTKLNDAAVEVDENRLEQELVLLAQKSDVCEELERLSAHVKEVRSRLDKKEPIGRRLDFLMQELNREANTLSSKSIVTNTTNAAIELKVLIEQMREQVQNVE